ncbi:uncharacterized protein HMPREF1541_02855 [Cyphellophora europaea CBS 101466]|uniref:Uncharacterized protein n=1 Tax=Cyphellophora europaea (strain CBS 101466) TaxID=1220924 RepID=W2S4R8_CYPE1|nr:uncharacterized protein HMPREF1541_02855 [Cyphellophora europaea CBS 101466]ETN43696.1 hypothetical protein HMPREF1541_02855 [Cyphellophora europaea CBS 101466]
MGRPIEYFEDDDSSHWSSDRAENDVPPANLPDINDNISFNGDSTTADTRNHGGSDGVQQFNSPASMQPWQPIELDPPSLNSLGPNSIERTRPARYLADQASTLPLPAPEPPIPTNGYVPRHDPGWPPYELPSYLETEPRSIFYRSRPYAFAHPSWDPVFPANPSTQPERHGYPGSPYAYPRYPQLAEQEAEWQRHLARSQQSSRGFNAPTVFPTGRPHTHRAADLYWVPADGQRSQLTRVEYRWHTQPSNHFHPGDFLDLPSVASSGTYDAQIDASSHRDHDMSDPFPMTPEDFDLIPEAIDGSRDSEPNNLSRGPEPDNSR